MSKNEKGKIVSAREMAMTMGIDESVIDYVEGRGERQEARRVENTDKFTKSTIATQYEGFKDFDFDTLWKNSEGEDKLRCEPLTDEWLQAAEEELGYKLPAAYIHLLKQRNGGTVKHDTFMIDEDNEDYDGSVRISGVFGISEDSPDDLLGINQNQNYLEDADYPDGVIICDTWYGETYVFLDYSECGPAGEPTVRHWDNQTNDVIFLADNFERFIRGLVEDTQNNQ